MNTKSEPSDDGVCFAAAVRTAVLTVDFSSEATDDYQHPGR